MRLFLVSLLFVFMVYCVPATAEDSPKLTKCYVYDHLSGPGGEPAVTDEGEKTCDGACSMMMMIGDGGKNFQLTCDNFPRKDAKEKPCDKNLVSDSFWECYCFTDLCFTKEMRKQVMYEYGKTGKVTMPVVVKPGPWDNVTDQGSTVFSSSFVFFTAVLVLSTL